MICLLIVVVSIAEHIGFKNIYLWILGTKQFTDAVIPFAALLVAITGLFTWRKQLRGNHSYNLATKIISEGHEFLNEVKKFRTSTIISTGEGMQELNRNKFKNVTSSSSLLISSLISSRAVMNEKIALEAIDIINMIVITQSSALVSLDISGKEMFRSESSEIFTRELKRTLVYDGLPGDPLEPKLSKLIKILKKLTKPYIK